MAMTDVFHIERSASRHRSETACPLNPQGPPPPDRQRSARRSPWDQRSPTGRLLPAGRGRCGWRGYSCGEACGYAGCRWCRLCRRSRPEAIRETQHGDAFARHRAKEPAHHQGADAVLLPGVERHHLLPVGGSLVQAVVAAEVHQVEDVFLEAAATKAWADGACHLLRVSSGGFSEDGDAVDRADQLGAAVETWWLMLFKKGIRSQPTG